MPFATDGKISQASMEGAIWITDEQYAAALQGMLEGKTVHIDKDLGLQLVTPKAPEPEPEVPVRGWAETVAAERFSREVAGIVYGTAVVSTDRESRALLDQELSASLRGFRAEPSVWKAVSIDTGEPVFLQLSGDQLEELGRAVYTYVQECFKREAELLVEGEGGNLETGWPSQV